jgi:beta-N-acetylhexosaminidase
MPADLSAAVKGVENAVANGTLTEERIDESVLRILALKEKRGILK